MSKGVSFDSDFVGIRLPVTAYLGVPNAVFGRVFQVSPNSSPFHILVDPIGARIFYHDLYHLNKLVVYLRTCLVILNFSLILRPLLLEIPLIQV